MKKTDGDTKEFNGVLYHYYVTHGTKGDAVISQYGLKNMGFNARITKEREGWVVWRGD